MTNSRWEILLDGLAKRALFWSPLRSLVLYKYRYAFTPAQLARLTALLGEAVAVPGDCLEVGCYRGYTTVFLNRHLDDIAPAKRYHAVDTFGGFVAGDVEHERSARGKDSREDARAFAKFTINSQAWFDATLRRNAVTRVTSHAAAVQDFAFPEQARYCFALIDVDLYLPTKVGLERIWPRLSPGGVVVVDDCQENHVYDGSRQALEEFAAAQGVAFEVVEKKLGVLRKPRA
jgi:O-methyltransferase